MATRLGPVENQQRDQDDKRGVGSMAWPLITRITVAVLIAQISLLLAAPWQTIWPLPLTIVTTVLAITILFTLIAFIVQLRTLRRPTIAKGWLQGLIEHDRGYALLDRDGQILDCNHQFAFLCHQPPEALMRADITTSVLKEHASFWPEIRHHVLSGISCRKTLTIAEHDVELLAFPLTTLAVRDGPHLVLELQLVVTGKMDAHASDAAIDHLPAGVIVVRQQQVIYVNEGFTELFAWTSDQILNVKLQDWLGVDSALQQWLSLAEARLRSSDVFESEVSLPRGDGRRVWCQIKASGLSLHEPQNGIVVLVSDASEQRKRQESLRQAAVVFEAASDSILILDAERRIRMVNTAFTRVTGYAPTDVIGRVTRLLYANRQPSELYEHIFTAVANNNIWQGEVWSRKKDGTVYPEWVNVNAVRNEAGQIVEYVVIASDITDRKRSEERLNYQANYDALTELPNRSLFIDRLRQAISRAKREDTQLALLFVDLDRFKNINDSMGHSAGDKLLVQVAKALRACVRESDTIARFGGDEFAIILSPIYGPKNAGTVAQTLLKVLSRPVLVDGYECLVGGSIGISIFPGDGQTPEDLVKNADAAMYRAKDEGRNTYQFFTAEMQQLALARIGLERDLRYAIERHEFVLNFQPKVALSTDKAVGLEVLVRWHSGKRGVVSPADFISLAEENGQIVALGEWVLRAACRQYVEWHKAGCAPGSMAVNVSGRQLRSPHFIKMVNDILTETQMPTAALELELTESFLMENEDQVMRTLNDLRGLGLHLSVDDFGTGYSSLSYLKRFPISTLKIDKSFVQDIPGDDEDLAIVAAILRMASALKLEVVAEGVETAEQLRILREMGCDVVQGYFFSRPLSAKDCTAYLQEQTGQKQLQPASS